MQTTHTVICWSFFEGGSESTDTEQEKAKQKNEETEGRKQAIQGNWRGAVAQGESWRLVIRRLLV